MSRESDRKCLNHARVHESAQSFDRCDGGLRVVKADVSSVGLSSERRREGLTLKTSTALTRLLRRVIRVSVT